MSKQFDKIKELVEKRDKARLGGGEVAIEKQHGRGKYTARERIDMLLDEGSFEEFDMFKLHRCHNFGMEKKQFLFAQDSRRVFSCEEEDKYILEFLDMKERHIVPKFLKFEVKHTVLG